MEYEGKIKLNGIEHDVEVIDGICYIDGVTTDEWLKTANILEVSDLAKIGRQKVEDVFNGNKPKTYKSIANEEYIKRSN